MIKNIEKKNIDDLKNFFENAVTSDDHRHDSFSQIVNNFFGLIASLSPLFASDS